MQDLEPTACARGDHTRAGTNSDDGLRFLSDNFWLAISPTYAWLSLAPSFLATRDALLLGSPVCRRSGGSDWCSVSTQPALYALTRANSSVAHCTAPVLACLPACPLRSQAQPLSLPPLPYAYDALEPFSSEAALRLHRQWSSGLTAALS